MTKSSKQAVGYVLLACLSFGIFWSAGLFFRADITTDLVSFHYVGRIARIVAFFVVAGIAWFRNISSRSIFFLATLFLLFAVFCFVPLLIIGSSMGIIAIIANAFLGLSGAFYSLLFIQYFSSLDPKICQPSIPFAFLLCHIIYLISLVLPLESPLLLELVASILGPALFFICIRKSNLLQILREKTVQKKPFNLTALVPTELLKSSFSASTKLSWYFREYYVVLLGAIIIPLFYGALAQMYTEAGINEGLFDFACESVTIASLFLIALLGLHEKGSAYLEKLFFLLLPLVATLLILIGDRIFLAGVIIKTARIVYLVACWTYFAKKNSDPRTVYFIFGIVMGLGHLSAMSGRFIGLSLHTIMGSAIEISLAAILMLIWMLTLISVHLISTQKKEVSLHERIEKTSFEERYKMFATKNRLSERESEILSLFVHGRSSQAIAQTLFISNNTVKTHLRNIYTKTGVHSRQEILDMIDEMTLPPS